jgi:hypothetical protein
VEVGPLSRGVILQPLSAPLKGGLRFLHHPLPAASLYCLTEALPANGEDYGLTVFQALNKEWVRLLLFAGGAVVHGWGDIQPQHRPPYLLVQACQHRLACSAITAFTKGSLVLAVPSTLALFRLMLTEPLLPHG